VNTYTIIAGLIVALIVFAALITGASAGSTVQRDAPTTRFYTPDGRSAGSATTYGNTTKFYGPDGRTGSATRNNQGR
jgi:hypothetical protein